MLNSLLGPFFDIGFGGTGSFQTLFNTLNQGKARKRGTRHCIDADGLTFDNFFALNL